jgi:hypothetical protein
VRSHADTLDQLTTAVAIFDAKEKLRFFNQAFQKLWDLEPSFLASAPDNALLLDRLRSDGKIAEQPEWRRWKENLLSAYRAVQSQEHLVAPARRAHGPRRRQSAVQRRRHLGLREPDGADEPREPLQHGRPGAGRNPRQPRRGRRRCSARTAASGSFNPAFGQRCGSVLGRRRCAQNDAHLRHPAHECDTLSPTTIRGATSSPRSPASTTSGSDRHGQAELKSGVGAALRRHPPAQWPGYADLRRRHRQRQCRARADRQERGVAEGRPAQERLRPARLIRAALAADQHHRLHRAPVAAGHRTAVAAPARICRAYRLVLGASY